VQLKNNQSSAIGCFHICAYCRQSPHKHIWQAWVQSVTQGHRSQVPVACLRCSEKQRNSLEKPFALYYVCVVAIVRGVNRGPKCSRRK
jgi:hypothetical protein